MIEKKFVKAGVLTIALVLSFLLCWEYYLRNKGLTVDYDDGEALWSDKRAMIYDSRDKATVFIGASRNKFDIDIGTWQNSTGENVIQLAVEGNSPLPVLDDLANDVNFKGKLIIDVTEGLIFTTSPNNLELPRGYIAYYKKRTPAQRCSFQINHILESQFVFLDKYSFSLNALLDRLPIKKRKDVFALPFEFPMEMSRVTFERQDVMMQKFLEDTTLQNRVKAIWTFFEKINDELPPIDKKLDSIFTSIKSGCDKIKARGGEIVFVRSPSCGPYLAAEKKAFPKEKYWDKLLSITGCEGIHFEDYAEIAGFTFPEWSHLSQENAIVFTKNLIRILAKEKGWTFPNKNSSL